MTTKALSTGLRRGQNPTSTPMCFGTNRRAETRYCDVPWTAWICAALRVRFSKSARSFFTSSAEKVNSVLRLSFRSSADQFPRIIPAPEWLHRGCSAIWIHREGNTTCFLAEELKGRANGREIVKLAQHNLCFQNSVPRVKMFVESGFRYRKKAFLVLGT